MLCDLYGFLGRNMAIVYMQDFINDSLQLCACQNLECFDDFIYPSVFLVCIRKCDVVSLHFEVEYSTKSVN